MMQCFNTRKTWMRILPGQLKRLKNQNVIEETFPPHTVNAIELCSNKKVAVPIFLNQPALVRVILPF